MISKLLITEVFRLQKLMGKSLIVEQFVAVADDILEFIGKISGRLSDETIELSKKLGQAVTEEEVIDALSKLVKSNKEIANYIIPKIMSTLGDAERKSITDAKLALQKLIRNKQITPEAARKMANNWVDKYVRTQFDGVNDIIKKEFIDFIETEIRKVNTPKPKINPKTITDVAGQSWEDIQPVSATQLKRLEQLYRQKGLGKSFFKSLKIFYQTVIDMMTKQYQLMDETLSLIKSLDTVENAAQKTDIAKKIGDNIQLLTERDMDNYLIIDEWVTTNVLDYQLKSKIKDLPGYQKAGALLNPETLATWKKTYGDFWTRRGKLFTQVNSILNPFSWFGDNIAKWEGTSPNAKRWTKWKSIIKGPEFVELRRYAKLGQTQSWEGIKKYADQFGEIPAVLNVSKELAYSYVALSAVLAFTDYLTDLFGNVVRNVPYVNQLAVIQQQILSYNQHIKKEGLGTGVESVEGYANFFKDLGTYYLDEFQDLNVAFPGLIDDFGVFWGLIRDFNFSEEDVKKIIVQGEKVKKEAKKAQESVVKSADTIIAKGNEVVNKIEDTELGFRYFIMNTWIDPTTKKSQLTGNEIFTKEGDIYVVDVKGVGRFEYKYNGTTFEQKK
jgi:hypothetical protein